MSVGNLLLVSPSVKFGLGNENRQMSDVWIRAINLLISQCVRHSSHSVSLVDGVCLVPWEMWGGFWVPCATVQ